MQEDRVEKSPKYASSKEGNVIRKSHVKPPAELILSQFESCNTCSASTLYGCIVSKEDQPQNSTDNKGRLFRFITDNSVRIGVRIGVKVIIMLFDLFSKMSIAELECSFHSLILLVKVAA